MKPYRIKNLYFQFIQNTTLDGRLTPEQAADCLADHGLIKLLPDRFLAGNPLTFYVWVKGEKEKKDVFNAKVFKALESWVNNEQL